MMPCPSRREQRRMPEEGRTPPAPDAVIVIPTLDEEEHLGAVLDTVRAEDSVMPIMVIDGGSEDSTREIVRARRRRDRNLYLVENPHRLQAAAVNIGALAAREMGARLMLRLDAHARYPEGFIGGVIAALDETGADSVVVPLLAEGRRGWQAAAAALQRSWLGHGGALHRRGGYRGWVEHGHHAGFRLDRFLALGGYQARLPACEDVEYDLRLAAAGGRIWMEDRWAVRYFPRSTPAALWRQMRRNGRWRLTVARATGGRLGPRQLAPVLGAGGALLSLSAGVLVQPALAAPAAGYAGLVLALAAASSGVALAPRVAFLALLSHLAYAVGVGEGVLRALPRPGLDSRLSRWPERLAASFGGLSA